MQMILSAIEGQGNPSEVSNGSTYVVIKTHFIVGRYQWAAILCRKDDVVKEISVRVTHDSRLSRVSTEDFYQGPSAASRTLESIGILSRGSLALTPGFMPPSAPRTSQDGDASSMSLPLRALGTDRNNVPSRGAAT